MKKIIQISTIILFTSLNAFAADTGPLETVIQKIQKDWTLTKYRSESNIQRIEGYRQCAAQAQKVAQQYPNDAAILIWQGICLSSEAELTKLTALSKVKSAKKLFERALELDEKALDGSAYTNLGVLYHRVPGWPIGFGDDKKAEASFKKVLAIAPHNIDANYFYALFLADVKEDYAQAIRYLNIALKAPSRHRPLADSKRREEINAKIIKFNKKL